MNTPEKWRLYEDRLAELVRGATEHTLPSEEYNISLKKYRIGQFVIRQFEQIFERSLDRNNGVDIDLSYNALSQQLNIQRLAISVDKKDKKAVIYNTDTLGLVASSEVPKGAKQEKTFLPQLSFSNAELMGMAEINQPDFSSVGSYAAWRGQTLEKARGWKINQSNTFVKKVATEESPAALAHPKPSSDAHLIRVSNLEEVDTDTAYQTQIQTVESIIESRLGNISTAQSQQEVFSTHAGIEFIQEMGGLNTPYTQVHLFKELKHSITTPDPLEPLKMKRDERREVKLTAATFSNYEEIAQLAFRLSLEKNTSA